ncbi:MAG: cytochrome P450 [Alphaproteobacteria bacterium]|nr:cytochrome P450 [Alphaproteobacteria bacterium]MCB9929338.1 cytochrome P450 [Alphaproteobacteria bacterium]
MPSDPALAEGFELAGAPASFLADPYPTYRSLRDHAPVKRLADGSLFLTRYADCQAVYKDPARFLSDKRDAFRPVFGDGSPLFEHHTTSLVFNDPPLHTRVRRLLAPAFTPRALEALRPRVAAFVDRLLDEAEAKGEFDLIGDLASALPVQLIGDMLGVPADERDPLRAWSLAILGALEPRPSAEVLAVGNRAVEDFKRYLRDLIRRRKAGALPAVEGEILSKLMAETRDGDRLSEWELLHNCIFLLNAGHETTTNLIGNGVEALFRHPAEFRRLCDDPGLIAGAVEELLRFESSNQLGNRQAATDCAIGGETVAAGTYIHVCIGAANRDPAEFPDPERLDLGRTPNRHLAFATGIHVCAGAALARMEGQVAIGKLVARFPGLEPAGQPVRGGRARFRGFLELPVRAG